MSPCACTCNYICIKVRLYLTLCACTGVYICTAGARIAAWPGSTVDAATATADISCVFVCVRLFESVLSNRCVSVRALSSCDFLPCSSQNTLSLLSVYALRPHAPPLCSLFLHHSFLRPRTAAVPPDGWEGGKDGGGEREEGKEGDRNNFILSILF